MQGYIEDPFSKSGILPAAERGDWLATSLGGMWSIDHPHPSDVHIIDIAAGLSRTCRYGGQLIEAADFLSVSEHSVIMTEEAVDSGLARSREDALAVLLHDAAEAYFGDMPTPLKARIPGFRALEDRAQAIIETAFGVTPDHLKIRKADIKLIDERIRIDERSAVIADPAKSLKMDIEWDKNPDLEPLSRNILGLNPREARAQFIETFSWVMEMAPANPETDVILARHSLQLSDHLYGKGHDFESPEMHL